jgi:hypothetical protein
VKLVRRDNSVEATKKKKKKKEQQIKERVLPVCLACEN